MSLDKQSIQEEALAALEDANRALERVKAAPESLEALGDYAYSRGRLNGLLTALATKKESVG